MPKWDKTNLKITLVAVWDLSIWEQSKKKKKIKSPHQILKTLCRTTVYQRTWLKVKRHRTHATIRASQAKKAGWQAHI